MKYPIFGISAMALAPIGAALAFAGVVVAQEHPRGPGDHGPGHSETRAEAATAAAAGFDRLDLNHDGKLDSADHAMRVNQMFDRLDTDHDGKISREEFLAAHPPFGMGGHGMGGHGMGKPGMDHPGMDHPGMPDGKMGGMRRGHEKQRMWLLMAIVHQADPSHTGTVTKDAFIAAALHMFDMADTNHDGVLTPEERRAGDQMLRQHMRGGMHRHGPEGSSMAGHDMPPPPPAQN